MMYPRCLMLVLMLMMFVKGNTIPAGRTGTRRIQRRRGFFTHKLFDDQIAQESSVSTSFAEHPNSLLSSSNKILPDPDYGPSAYAPSSGSSGYAPSSESSLSYLPPREGEEDTSSSNSRTFNPFSLLRVLNNKRNGLQLGLSFSVPFITIPLNALYDVNGSGGISLSEIFNINFSTLISVGILILGAIFVLPYLISLFTGMNFGTGFPDFGEGFPDFSIGRSDDHPGILASIDNALSKYNVDSMNCLQKSICSYVKSASNNLDEGKANSFDKIVDGIASNSYLESWMDGTRIMDAVKVAKGRGSCSAMFPKCPSLGSAYRLLSTFISTAASLPL